MIDNRHLIEPLLEFGGYGSNDFYFCQIIKRKKENPGMASKNDIVKSYYVNHENFISQNWDEMTTICNSLNARLMINLNKKDFRKVHELMLKTSLESYFLNCHRSNISLYDSCCGKYIPSREHHKWIIDVDQHDVEEGSLRAIDKDIIQLIPTKNGWHIIVRPFEVLLLDGTSMKYELHKNSPTNLYIP